MQRIIGFTITLLNVTCAWAASDLPPMPAPAPQKDEVAISGENDLVATRCRKNEGELWNKLGLTPLRVVITKSPMWGTIWRSDAAFPTFAPGESPILFRTVCWEKGVLERPLVMFDPSQSIPRL
jgi:hypothetical protein